MFIWSHKLFCSNDDGDAGNDDNQADAFTDNYDDNADDYDADDDDDVILFTSVAVWYKGGIYVVLLLF